MSLTDRQIKIALEQIAENEGSARKLDILITALMQGHISDREFAHDVRDFVEVVYETWHERFEEEAREGRSYRHLFEPAFGEKETA